MTRAVSSPSAGIGHTAPHKENPWFSDWQDGGHASLFDSRAHLSDHRLKRQMETFNDVVLLGGQLGGSPARLLEVGCATGEFYRYLRGSFPRVEYWGMDISEPAIGRAKQKYPEGHFFVCDPAVSVRENLGRSAASPAPEILYSKDVLHHQTDPWGFLDQLLEVPSETLVLRTRTRDRGATVLDPELSCQFHYQGWMPYIVLNLEELTRRIQQRLPEAEVQVLRHRMVLGGRENRYLPKECYLPETGTAETALGIFRRSAQAGRVSVRDRDDSMPAAPLIERILAKAAAGRRRS